MRFHEKKVSSVFFPGFSTPYAGRLQKKRDPEKRSKKKGTTRPGRCFVFFPHIFCRLLSELKSPPSSPRLLHSALPLAPARPCFPCLASDGLKNKTTAATAGSRIPSLPRPRRHSPRCSSSTGHHQPAADRPKDRSSPRRRNSKHQCFRVVRVSALKGIGGYGSSHYPTLQEQRSSASSPRRARNDRSHENQKIMIRTFLERSRCAAAARYPGPIIPA